MLNLTEYPFANLASKSSVVVKIFVDHAIDLPESTFRNSES